MAYVTTTTAVKRKKTGKIKVRICNLCGRMNVVIIGVTLLQLL